MGILHVRSKSFKNGFKTILLPNVHRPLTLLKTYSYVGIFSSIFTIGTDQPHCKSPFCRTAIFVKYFSMAGFMFVLLSVKLLLRLKSLSESITFNYPLVIKPDQFHGLINLTKSIFAAF